MKDVNQAGFRSFFKKSAKAYSDHLANHKAKPELVEPWKVDGKSWHLSQKSMSARQIPRWQPTFLLGLIGRFKSLEPNLVEDWKNKTAVQLHTPDGARRAKIVTNMGRGLRVELAAPPNLITPALADRLGEGVEIKRRGRADCVIFWLASLQQNDPAQLREVWRLCSESNSTGGQLRSA